MSFGYIAQGISRGLDQADDRRRQQEQAQLQKEQALQRADEFDYQQKLRVGGEYGVSPEDLAAEREHKRKQLEHEQRKREQTERLWKTPEQIEAERKLAMQNVGIELAALPTPEEAAGIASRERRLKETKLTFNEKSWEQKLAMQDESGRIAMTKLKNDGFAANLQKLQNEGLAVIQKVHAGTATTKDLEDLYNDTDNIDDDADVRFQQQPDGTFLLFHTDAPSGEGVPLSKEDIIDEIRNMSDPKGYLERMDAVGAKRAERRHEMQLKAAEYGFKLGKENREVVRAELKEVSKQVNDVFKDEVSGIGQNFFAMTRVKSAATDLISSTNGAITAEQAVDAFGNALRGLDETSPREIIEAKINEATSTLLSNITQKSPVSPQTEVKAGAETPKADSAETPPAEGAPRGEDEFVADAVRTQGADPAEVRKAYREKYGTEAETEAERRARIRKENSQAINNPQRGKSDTSPDASQPKSPSSPVRKGSIADAVVEHAPSAAKAAYKDVAQAASAILGAPIDLSNDILNAIGIEIDKPYGGYKSWIDLFNKALDEGDKVKYIDRWKTHGGAGKSVKPATPALGIDAFGAL